MTKRPGRHLSSQHSTRAGAAAADYPALVRAAAGGNRDALERLLMRTQEVAYRFSVTVCGNADEAEDVMQEALLKTYQHVSRIKAPEAFRTWLYRTVRNACLMRHRLHADEPRQLLSLDALLPVQDGDGERPLAVPDPSRGPEQVLVDTRLRQQLRRAFRRLPASFRLVVFLREMEGLSTREAAQVLGISEANVKTRLHRAHLAMRKDLQP